MCLNYVTKGEHDNPVDFAVLSTYEYVRYVWKRHSKGMEGGMLEGRGWGLCSCRVFIGSHPISCFADLSRCVCGCCSV
jgi:hypothetical protein